MWVAGGGRELVLGDNGLSKPAPTGKCTTDHYQGFAPELQQPLQKEQIARFLFLLRLNTSLKEKYGLYLSCLYLKLLELEFHFLKSASHLERKNMSLHLESDASYLVFDAKFCPPRLIPFPFVLWQSLTPWTVNPPPPHSLCHMCVIELTGMDRVE